MWARHKTLRSGQFLKYCQDSGTTATQDCTRQTTAYLGNANSLFSLVSQSKGHCTSLSNTYSSEAHLQYVFHQPSGPSYLHDGRFDVGLSRVKARCYWSPLNSSHCSFEWFQVHIACTCNAYLRSQYLFSSQLPPSFILVLLARVVNATMASCPADYDWVRFLFVRLHISRLTSPVCFHHFRPEMHKAWILAQWLHV